MKLSLEFLNTRLNYIGSRCEPNTSVEDRNGYKPQGAFLHKAGLRLADIDHAGGYAEFDMVERSGPDTISIRKFDYSKRELENAIRLLETDMRNYDTDDYATEWNWLQFSRAIMIMEMTPQEAGMALMRDKASTAPIIIGGGPDNIPEISR
jgi:hypothetical protein